MIPMIPILDGSLWDLIEMEADVLYYVNDAKKAAVTINSDQVGHLPIKHGDRYTVWFGRGITRFSFTTIDDARRQAEEILSKPSIPIQIRVVFPHRKRKNYSYYIKPKINSGGEM